MRLPLGWLEDYVKTKETPEKLAELLTLSGNEVEKIIYPPRGLEKVIVGEILSVVKHPNAERLTVVEVTTGRGKKRKIVCGATNIRVGNKVPVALSGTTLPSGLTIEKTEIRGVASEGMLCAEDELLLGVDHTGIMILGNEAKAGDTLTKALGLSYAVLDVDVTPNRSDCFSVEGLSREVAALTGKSIKLKSGALPKSKNKTLSISVEKGLADRYALLHFTNVAVKESPQWIKTRLIEGGVRPINAIVDITNYVMLATGQPLHAFDAEKLAKRGSKIHLSVRRGERGEKLPALDGKIYALSKDTIVIADSVKPVAIGGVMGGEETGVTMDTKSIVLEAAVFNSKLIRRGAKELGLRSESSHRFEKGIDSEATERALSMARELIERFTKGSFLSYESISPAKALKSKAISMPISFIEKVIGIHIPNRKIIESLSLIGFNATLKRSGMLSVSVPSWRHDVTIPADIVDEVGRLYGINTLPQSAITAALLPQEPENEYKAQNEIKRLLFGSGFNEILSYSFYSDTARRGDALSMFCNGRFDHIEISNPLNAEQQYLRKSIIPFVLNALSKNISIEPDSPSFKLYEIGKIFIPQGKVLPKENIILAGAVSFESGNREENLVYLKGIIENIFKILNIPANEAKISSLHEGRIIYEIKGTVIASALILSSKERDAFKLKRQVGIFEASLEHILFHSTQKHIYAPISKFPAVIRDLAFEVDAETLWGTIEKAVVKSSKYLEAVRFLNQYYIDEKIKSLAFRLIFRSEDRTLTAEEVDAEVVKITSLLKDKLHAKLRGSGG